MDANTSSRWRIVRNHKAHFAIVRDTPEGREVHRSASGREASFRTYAGAQRQCRRLNKQREGE